VIAPQTRPGIPEQGTFYYLFADWADVVFAMKAVMVATGWTVRRSGDGVATFAFGDVVTDVEIRNNANCWFELAFVGAAKTRVFVFQRLSTLAIWQIKYTDNDDFPPSVEGTATTPVVYPAGAQQRQIFSGAWVTLGTGNGVTTGYRWNAAVRQAEPNWFWFAGWFTPDGATETNCGGAFFMDAVEPSSVRCDAGGVAQDFDPVVVGITRAAVPITSVGLTASADIWTWLDRTAVATGVFVNIVPMRYNTSLRNGSPV